MPTKMLKSSSEICNGLPTKHMEFWNITKIAFSYKLKLADIKSVYKKKDPTLEKFLKE